MRQVILFQDEDGVWIAECPSLPGVVSDGATRNEAVKNVKEAIEVYIESLVAHGEPVPADFSFEVEAIAV